MRSIRSSAGGSSLRWFFLFLFFAWADVALAQKDPAALERSRKGFEHEQAGRLGEALYEYNEAIKLDPAYPYPYSRIGGMYQTLRNYNLATSYLHRSIQLDSNFDVYNYFNLGLAFRVLTKHDSAALAFQEFLKRIQPVSGFDSVNMREADFWIKFNLQSLAERAKGKTTDEPIAMGSINSEFDEFGASITADGETLYFTSRRPSSNIQQYYETKDYGDDLFITTRDSVGNWRRVLSLDPPLNNLDEDGTASISADGLTMYFALCRRPEGLGDCDLYVSEQTGEGWTPPQNIGNTVNSPEWDGQPTITADGSTMYFSSRRSGSVEGSEDIYVAYRDQNGSWTKPINLGEVVNTRFNDRSPFISADGNTLYFSSNGHPGFGNYDIFMTRKLGAGEWSVPVNLGAPLNSFGEDAFLTIPARGDTIFYSTQRDNAQGDLDIYKTKLPKEFQPGPVTVLAGRVIDKNTKQPLAATINVNDLAEDQLVAVYRANKVTGKFYITLGTGKHYGITANAPGYVFYSENYKVPDTISYREIIHDLPLTPITLASNEDPNKPTEPIKKDPANNDPVKKDPVKKEPVKKEPVKKEPVKKEPVKKEPVKKEPVKKEPVKKEPVDSADRGERNIIALNNLFFDFNKATLRKESITELKNLIAFLKQNPMIKIEIAGHTDNVGSELVNDKLSQSRAEAVRTYLVRNGITAGRLRAKGYGSRVPIAPNDTEENMQRNRRTEFEILEGAKQ